MKGIGRGIGEALSQVATGRPEPGTCECGAELKPIKFSPGRWGIAAACDVCIFTSHLSEDWTNSAGRNRRPRFELHAQAPRDFDGYQCPPGDVAALELAKAFRPQAGRSLYLHGKSGTGKTHLAVAIASHAATTRPPVIQGVAQAKIPDEVRGDVADRLEVLFPDGCPWPLVSVVQSATVPQLLATMRMAIDLDRQSPDGIREELIAAGLLVLDDLGTEKVTHWTREILFDVLDRRLSLERPTVITSNLNLDDLERRLTNEKDDPYGERVASRIAGGCEVLEVKSADYRRRR